MEKTTDQHQAEAISQVYTELLAKQQPLGYEFSKVLHDNLWNLYEDATEDEKEHG